MEKTGLEDFYFFSFLKEDVDDDEAHVEGDPQREGPVRGPRRRVVMAMAMAVGVIVAMDVAHRPGSISSSSPLRRERERGVSDTPTRQKKVSPCPGPKPPRRSNSSASARHPCAISGSAENDLPLRAYQRKISGVIWGCRCRTC